MPIPRQGDGFAVLVRSIEGHRLVGDRWEPKYLWTVHVYEADLEKAEAEAARIWQENGSKARVVPRSEVYS